MSDIFASQFGFFARSVTLGILFLTALRALVLAKAVTLGSFSSISIIFAL